MDKIKRSLLSMFKQSEFEKSIFKALYDDGSS